MNHVTSGVKAYSKATYTVNKTRQVVMLYDGAIRFLQQGAEAIERKDYETRFYKLQRSIDIIVGLQACLDFESGGASAQILHDFYASLEMRIYAIHRTNDLEACRAITQEMKEMRDVWDRIDRSVESPAPTDVPPSPGETAIVSA
jgi:flagellar protein FliS